MLLVALVAATSVAGQVPADPVLEGRVVQGEGGDPLPDAPVVLHRVASGSAGSVDSTSADASGRFRFSLPTVPGSEESEVYFASVRFRDVLYFGPAVAQADQLDSLYVVEVHDTAVAPAEGRAFPVTTRNLLFEEAEDEDGWSVVDLIEIRNDGDRTFVARPDGLVWTHPLPTGATDFEIGQSDLPPSATTFEDGSIRVRAPVPPGERTYLVRYRLPEDDIRIPLPGRTDEFELLVREPGPEITVAGLERVPPVEIEPGSNYRRFSGADLSNHVVEVTPGDPDSEFRIAWVAVVLALVLTGAGLVAVRRGRSPAPAGAEGPGKEEILLRIAELDDSFQRRDDPSGAQRERYRRERRRLKALLREME